MMPWHRPKVTAPCNMQYPAMPTQPFYTNIQAQLRMCRELPRLLYSRHRFDFSNAVRIIDNADDLVMYDHGIAHCACFSRSNDQAIIAGQTEPLQ